jgi:hypothetical protein
MSAHLLRFSAAPAVLRMPQRRYRVHDLAWQLALEDLSPRQQVERLRQLARLAGLPLPLNPRIWKGKMQHGADAICAASLWNAAEVDAWLHQPDPVSPAMAACPPPPPSLHAEMRSRALHLASSRDQQGRTA